jgi:hypothetical protein
MAAYQTSFRGPNKEEEVEVGRYFYPFWLREKGEQRALHVVTVNQREGERGNSSQRLKYQHV